MPEINTSKPFSSYTVLYVEDNEDISEELCFFLKPRVRELYVGYDGEEGVELFKENRPDLVITDIEMPKMNGLEMIERIRELDKEIPIIITTAFNESDYLLKAINLQVDGYLIKPVNLRELVKRLHKTFEPLELKKQLIVKNHELEDINTNLDKIALEKTDELKFLYNHDPLTGLYNFVKLKHELNTKTYKYLILLDISGFSMINKQYGKEFANKILKAMANSLKDHISADMKLFKTESDRFVILTKEDDAKRLELICEQIISYYDNRAIEVDEVEVFINFSIGVTKINENEFATLNAEYALDIGKDIGSRYYYFYNESADRVQKEKETIKWLNITKWMIQNDAIEPFYQAIADIKSKEIVKFEVLARGNYEDEVIAPYFFIEAAERLGLIGAITRIMISKSFSFFEDTAYSFSINLSQRDLLDGYIIPFLQEKLERHQINPKRITLEILENVTVGEHHLMILKQLRRLKEIGFEIAIDDFGVENSNFSRLIEIDFDYIKLDGVFVKRLVENEKDRKIVEAIVSLAHALNIKTVAEYVENSEILEVLKECGVDYAQGYFIGKPQSGAQTLMTLNKETV